MGDVRISAKSTLITLNRSIEVISGNLTGASIFGFKGVRLSFADTLVNILRSGTGATGGNGGLNPIQVGTGGITVGATTTDFSQGSIVQTKNAGDVAIQGNAFFTTVDAAGRITYTRNGEFHFDNEGNLVTNDGLYVLGVFDDLREITQNGRLVDFDDSIDFSEETDPIGKARVNNRNGVTMNWAGLVNIPVVDINQNTLNIVGSTSVMSLILGRNTEANPAVGLESLVTLFSFLDLDRVDGLQDRVLPQTFVAAGSIGTLSLQAGITVSYTGEIVLGCIIGPTSVSNTTGEFPVTLRLTSTNNFFSNTSLDNARLIAQAINDLADRTGLGASIIINANKLDQAAIVLTHVQRALSQVTTRLSTKVETPPGSSNTNLFESLASTGAGVLENAKDNRGNLMHRISLKSLIGRSPRFVPQAGDRFQFDSTGALVNTSRGQDESSAPPFNTGIHIALTKFANADGMQKLRGSSQFSYSEAAGDIIIGYGNLDKGKAIDTKRGVETSGESIIGTENSIIPQALEASNTSITEALPDLTIAQKSFTSNTKVVNVGNSIVDDLNGLIR